MQNFAPITPRIARKMPRQARAQARLERILDTSEALLVAEGPAGAGTDAVATAAGVPVGSIYQYFPNKQSLWLAVAERSVARVDARIADALADAAEPSAGDWQRIVTDVIAAYAQAQADEPVQQVLQPLLGSHCEWRALTVASADQIADLCAGIPMVQALNLPAPVLRRAIRLAVETAIAGVQFALNAADPAEREARVAETLRLLTAYMATYFDAPAMKPR